MVKSGTAHTITMDKLMLTKDAALAGGWDNAKQAQWGNLTAIAIKLTSQKFKRGEFKSMMEVLTYVAFLRSLIGAILNHSSKVGMLRTEAVSTPITEHPSSPYKLLFPEFKSWVELINENEKLIPGDAIQLSGKIVSDDSNESNEVTYPRSKVMANSQGFQILHSPSGTEGMFNANLFFQALTNKQLDQETKQKYIQAIYYYVLDTMPCERGSSAVSQMIYHALEDAYLGKISYLGKLTSQFGHSQGVTADLAAMLSHSFEEFRDYFIKNNIDSEIEVIDMPIADYLPAISSTQLLKKIDAISVEVARYEKLRDVYTKVKESGVMDFRQTDWSQQMTFLKSLVEGAANVQELQQVQVLLQSLLEAISQRNGYLYHYFFNTLTDQTPWPKVTAQLPDNVTFEALAGGHRMLGSINTAVAELYSNVRISLLRIKGVTNASLFKAQLGTGYLPALAPVPEGTSDKDAVSLYFASFEDFIQKYPHYSEGLDYLVKLIQIIEAQSAQGLSREQIIEENFKRIYEEDLQLIPGDKRQPYAEFIKRTQSWGINIYKRPIARVYDNLAELKVGLLQLTSLKPLLKLKEGSPLAVLLDSSLDVQKSHRPKL